MLVEAALLCAMTVLGQGAEDPTGPDAVRKRLLERDTVRNLVRRNPGDALRRRKGDPDEEAAAQESGVAPTATAPGAGAGAPPTPPPRPSPTQPVGAAAATTTAAAPASASAPASTSAAPTEIDNKAREKKGKFAFEFSKAEVVDIVKAISDMTQRNFIIPERLKSQKVTILSPSKISASEAYQVFLTALAVNGITVVKSGKFYKLLEAKEAIKSTIPTCLSPEDECPTWSDQLITAILHVRYVDANQLNNVLKALISKEGEITVFAPTNALIISEFAPNLERLRRIMDTLDQPGGEDELQIVPIQYATATEIADKLGQIFDISTGKGGTAAGPKAPRKRPEDGQAQPAEGGSEADVQISKIIPDDRTNQLIIKANRRSFEAIKNLISKLDVPISGDAQGRVHVYYLENASSEELSSTLSSLAQGQGQQKARPAGQPADKGGGPESAVLFEGEVKITADKATNSLLVMSSAHDFRMLRSLIEKLDRPRRQVYVEAAILEVNVSDNNSAGINWHGPITFGSADPAALQGGLGFVQSAQASGGISPTLSAFSNPAAILGVAGGAITGLVGKPISIPVGDDTIEVPSFGVILRWLETTSNANVLSTPHILATDNEEASIEVGQKIPFQRGTALPTQLGNLAGLAGGTAASAASSLGNLGGLFSATDRIDVSLKLNIKPQINERNRVKLEIEQNIEDLVGKEESTGQPITANRAAKTVVVVEDQQTVVIGGLMRDRTRESESKIPLLGDLPIIGWLFKQRSTETEKVNLLLVLTPYIIRSSDDFQRVYDRKMREHEEFAAEFYGSVAAYRAHIDFSKKSGPFARIAETVLRERNKLENGGDGSGDGLVITPSQGGSSLIDAPTSDAGASGPVDTIILPVVPSDGPVVETEPGAPTPTGGGVEAPPAGDGPAPPAEGP